MPMTNVAYAYDDKFDEELDNKVDNEYEEQDEDLEFETEADSDSNFDIDESLKHHNDSDLSWYLHEIGQIDLLTEEEERDLCKRVREGDIDARNKIVSSNLRLVVMYAKKYLPYATGLTLEDLIQEGNLGVIRAVKTFDPDKGRFTTYASHWINQSISRALYNTGRLIRIPVFNAEKGRKYLKAKNELEAVLGMEPTVEQIAEHLGVSVEKAAEYYSYVAPILSLNAELAEPEHYEDGFSLMDVIKDDETKQPEYIVIEQLALREEFEKLFSRLSEKEKNVLCLRFGYYDGQPRTLEEVGNMYHVTRERIRQIEGNALKKLRAPWNKKYLVDFLNK